jgi:membrane associated rhomboid family serine protease
VGGLIPLSDASGHPVHFPIVTTCIILTNFFVFALELRGGDAFVLRWAAVAANITAGHDWITILTAMFLHGSWSHIIGNMIFIVGCWPRHRRLDESIALPCVLHCRGA